MPNPDVEDIVYAERYLGRKGEPLTAIGVYQSGVLYPKGVIVADRGGLWFSLVKTSTRPISGNTDWTLVGGTPYVIVVVDPVGLTTAPFFDATSSGPGLVIIPAPGPGLWLELLGQVVLTSTDGDDWGADGVTRFGYGDATQQINSVGDGPLIGGGGGGGIYIGVADVTGAIPPITALSQYVDQPIVAWTKEDVTAGGTIFGTRSLVFYARYRINASPAVLQPSTFFAISAVNQGTKTLTVSPDPTAIVQPGDTITIVGSTGNNDTYTVASRDATHIVMMQAIPDSTADGWIKKA